MHGFLNLDKPTGITSRQVVDVVKRVLRKLGFKHATLPKLGHVGTLDPLATGVLVVAVGAATRLIDVVHSRPKAYRGTFVLGQRSDTDDITGQVVDVPGSWAEMMTRERIETALTDFRGRIEQVPPRFSAVRVAGKRAYKLARRGKDVEIPAKEIELYRVEITSFEFPHLTLDIECGSGTYIRALGRDLGERLGCGAVMSELIRTRVGPFDLEQSVAPDHLTAESLQQHLQPCRAAVSHFPAYDCNESERSKIPFGLSFAPRLEGWQTSRSPDIEQRDNDLFALLDASGTLLAVAGWAGHQPELRPRINLVAKN